MAQKGLFSKKRKAVVDYEMIELANEVDQLRKELLTAETKLFGMQKETLKRHRSCKKIRSSNNYHNLGKGVQSVVEDSDRERLESNLDLYLQTTGIKVAYCDDARCCVMFEICTSNMAIAEHAIEILKNIESSKVGKCSMPLGFQYKNIVKQFPEVCAQNFILELHKGLVAYYSRLDQLKRLKEIKPSDVKLFHSSDGDMVELCFLVAHLSLNWSLNVCARLIYEISNDRPNGIEIQAEGLEKEYLQLLQNHLENFLLYSLDEAFDKLRYDFSVDKGDFAIILKAQINHSKDTSKAPKSRIQDTNDYLSDAELQQNEASNHESESNLSMNKSLWNIIQVAKNKHCRMTTRNRRNKIENTEMRSTKGEDVVKLKSALGNENTSNKSPTKPRFLGQHSSRPISRIQVQHLSQNSSKYVPSESDDNTSEGEPESESTRKTKPIRKQSKLPTQIERYPDIVTDKPLEIEKPALNIPARNLRSSNAAKTSGQRSSNLLLKKKVKKADEESEEDELDIKERIQAISKVTQWLRSTPLPEGDTLE